MARVFIFSNHPLLGQGIERLLRQATDIQVLGQETDTGRAIACITELHPDVVIMDDGDPASDLTAAMTRILKMEPPVQVIGLDLRENKIHLYRREEREARGIENLVDAINSQMLFGKEEVR